MYRTDTKKLYEEVNKGYVSLKNAKNTEEKLALANYIGNLYRSISAVQDEELEIKEKTVFGSHKNFQKIFKKIDLYEMKMLENFVSEKDFHQKYLKKIVLGIEDKFKKINDDKNSKTTFLSFDDFYLIFYDFMKSINQEKLFEKFHKEKRIYRSNTRECENLLGHTVFNPISGDIDIFIDDFNYTVHSMYSLAHEFGHVYDNTNFNESIDNYNRYFYQSFYGEIFSKLFERLFLEYMIKNNILIDEAKDELLFMEFINYEYLLGSYMLTLLGDEYLLSNSYQYMSREKFFEMIESKFANPEYIYEFILNSTYFDIGEDFTYTYGDIISMFLKIQVENYGFDNDLISEVLKFRSGMFDSKVFEKYDFDSDRYIKLHNKEFKLLKK